MRGRTRGAFLELAVAAIAVGSAGAAGDPSADKGSTDVDPAGLSALGARESSDRLLLVKIPGA